MQLEDLIPKEKKVAVKLHARCYVDHQIREAGEVVEVAEIHAESFGELVNVKKAETPSEEKTAKK
ncbi:MAG: hypothetical protein IPL32_19930 [Chloracidobacterium sp.]|nr:hypothetical protein [Chloracidobacterium sp.]